MEPRAAGAGGGDADLGGESAPPRGTRAQEKEAAPEREREQERDSSSPVAVSLAMSDHIYQKKEGGGAQNIPLLGDGDLLDDHEMQDYEDSEEDLNWELEDGMENSDSPEAEPPAKEDWDTELIADQGNPYGAEDIHRASIQEFCLWAPRAQQGDMIYDPSWHHPAPLTPHYSKMVFETGQFDDAED